MSLNRLFQSSIKFPIGVILGAMFLAFLAPAAAIAQSFSANPNPIIDSDNDGIGSTTITYNASGYCSSPNYVTLEIGGYTVLTDSSACSGSYYAANVSNGTNVTLVAHNYYEYWDWDCYCYLGYYDSWAIASTTIQVTGPSITSSAGTGGSISPSGATTVAFGGNQTYTITPNSGYAISGLTVDGSFVTPASSYTFSNVTANHTIAATFTQQFTITSSAGSGGSISPSGSTILNSGGSQTYTMTSNSGYAISGLTVDGNSVTPTSSYTFSNITANHTIVATFSASGPAPSLSKEFIYLGGKLIAIEVPGN
jgi:hypothetical protein